MSPPDSAPAEPIQLSVHTLPRPADAKAERTRLGRLKMLLVWAVCAAPVVASYFTYYVVRPESRANYGALITPARPMPRDEALPLRGLDGQPVKASALKGQWLLVTVAGGQCDALCERQLYLQRQLRESLGRDKERVDRVWLVDDGAPVRAALLPGMNRAWVLRTPPAALAAWLAPQEGHRLAEHLFLVDPRGGWMMRFPADADPSRVKKDLLRLMKANESWDEAGR